MADTTMRAKQPTLARLDWECSHFGYCVAQLANPDLTDAELAASLRLACREGVRLLVWPTVGGREVPRALLDEFAGTLVDRKATFCRQLVPVIAEDPPDSGVKSPVVRYTATTVSMALAELAISAGVYSRFHVDRHFTDERFEAMYRRWIERSVTGEMADIVLVVPRDHRDGAVGQGLGGMITLSESGGVASIGLVAVATAVRGTGIGSALMHAAHRWMQHRGASEAQVVTQLANLPACRLYERSGYRLSRVQHYYHFWPLPNSEDS